MVAAAAAKGLRASFDKERPMGELDRITQQPSVMGGKACIRGMRVTVGMIVGQIAAGHDIEEILADYPYLARLAPQTNEACLLALALASPPPEGGEVGRKAAGRG
jgi:uncharacterized protein (DUF433 family)